MDRGQLAQKGTCPQVGGLAQAVLPGKGLRGALWEAERPGDNVGGVLVEVVIGQASGIHARIGDQETLQAIEDEQEGLAVEDGE